VPRNRRALPIVFLVLSAVFIIGVVQLFVLRFERGDVYPSYSSLRSDPLGSKAYYESLDSLSSLHVQRNYRTGTMLEDLSVGTLFYLGINSLSVRAMHKDLIEDFEAIAKRGGRVLITFVPEGRGHINSDEEKNNAGEATDGKRRSQTSPKSKDKDQPDEEESVGLLRRPVSLADRWGFGVHNAEWSKDSENGYASVSSQNHTEYLPRSIRWLTTLLFSDLNNAWRVIYTRDGHPVIIERSFEGGTIVLSAGSYFISNEALMKHRYPTLLAWLVGNNRTVIFDETHFGVRENIGIAALGRRYRLHGLAVGLLLLAVLYGWKNSTSFFPPYSVRGKNLTGGDDVFVEGKDTSAGFVNLLRRTVAPGEILSVCFEEWKRSLPRYQRHSTAKLERMKEVVLREKTRGEKQSNPVASYVTMSQIWKEGKL